MRYAVISDIHANLSALKAVLADAAREGADCVVCLGDVVGYGPEPAKTLALVRSRCSAVIAGNHDDAVSGRMDAEDFIDLAGDAVDRHRRELSRDDISYLRDLPYSMSMEGASAVHGDLVEPSSFCYIDSVDAASENFAAADFSLLFAGHTHVPEIFLTGRSGAVYRIDPCDFTLEEGKRYIVNPGSVGYPRECDGRCLSSYVVYDSSERTVSYRFLPFSVASVMQRGRGQGSPIARIAIPVAIAAAATGVAAWMLFSGRPQNAESNIPPAGAAVAQPAQEASPAVIARKSITIPPSAKSVKANLSLAKGSEPALLHVTFVDSTGKTIVELPVPPIPVKRSSTGRVAIPKGATSATFSVKALPNRANPDISGFAPSVAGN